MKNGPRLKAIALASGASLAASFGIAKGIERIAPAGSSAPSAAGKSGSAPTTRRVSTGRGAAPSGLLVIKRDDGRVKYVYTQAPPTTTYVPAPAAPAPAPAPVTRTS